MPLLGSGGGGAGRGSGAKIDFFPLPLAVDDKLVWELSRLAGASKPLSAFSSSLAWLYVDGKPSRTHPVPSGIRLKK